MKKNILIRIWLSFYDTLLKQETLPTHFSMYESQCVCGQQPKGSLLKKKKKSLAILN